MIYTTSGLCGEDTKFVEQIIVTFFEIRLLYVQTTVPTNNRRELERWNTFLQFSRVGKLVQDNIHVAINQTLDTDMRSARACTSDSSLVFTNLHQSLKL